MKTMKIMGAAVIAALTGGLYAQNEACKCTTGCVCTSESCKCADCGGSSGWN